MAMLLLLFAAAAPGKERAALQADLDSLATTLDSMLGHFEKTGMADVAQAVIAQPIGWSNDDRAPALDGHEKQYPVFNTDLEAVGYFTGRNMFIESEADISPPWTGTDNPPLDVVLSFGAANGGFDTVVKVAGVLKQRGLTSYIDANYLPSQAGSYVLPQPGPWAGCGCPSYSHPRNVNWKAWYKRAMLDAATMIFIVTPAWLASPFCAEELGWAVKEREGDEYLNIIFASPGVVEDNNTPVSSKLLGKLSNLIFETAGGDGLVFKVVQLEDGGDPIQTVVGSIAAEVESGATTKANIEKVLAYMQNTLKARTVTTSVTGDAKSPTKSITFTDADGGSRVKATF